MVPLTRPAPRSLPCASGSEEPSACCIVASAPEGVYAPVRPGPCSSGHMVLKRAPWGLSVRPLGSEELSLVRQSAPMLQTPSSPLPLLLRRGVACSARGQSSAPPFRRGVGGGLEQARLAMPSLRGGLAVPALGMCPLPRRGVGSRQAPVGLANEEGQAPRCPPFRWASPFRRWASALHRGDSSR